MAQMWQAVVVVAVFMASMAHGGPLGDITQADKKSLLTAPQHSTEAQDGTALHVNPPEAQDGKASHLNPPAADGTSNTDTRKDKVMMSLNYPDNAIVSLAGTRPAWPQCNQIGASADPTNCIFFYFCVPVDQEHKEFIQTLNKCKSGFRFDSVSSNCMQGDCIEVQLDPGMGPPSPPATSSSEVPSWLSETPEWFEKTPWWFKTPPAWFHTPPAWFNAPPKSQVLSEQIQVEAGPGFEIERPDQIIKNIGVSNESSPAYYDDKTLRINIPIKIVQQ